MARPYISVEIERRVRNAARNRCGYCLSPQHLVRATVTALCLSSDPDALEVRSYWVLAGWHPPED